MGARTISRLEPRVWVSAALQEWFGELGAKTVAGVEPINRSATPVGDTRV